MESRAKLFGHPIHPMLIVFPLGLFATSLIFDVVHMLTSNPRWGEMAFWLISAGLIGGLAAALFGYIDYLAIPHQTRAKRIGLLHGYGNGVVLVLFLVSWFIRFPSPPTLSPLAIALSVVGVALAGVTGWLGGELVDRLGVGVDDGAHLNAPSSLSGRAASESAAPRSTP